MKLPFECGRDVILEEMKPEHIDAVAELHVGLINCLLSELGVAASLSLLMWTSIDSIKRGL